MLLVGVRLVVQVLAADEAEPAQSGRQRIFSGSASATASWAHAERSRFAPWMYGVVSCSSSGDSA